MENFEKVMSLVRVSQKLLNSGIKFINTIIMNSLLETFNFKVRSSILNFQTNFRYKDLF